MKKIGILYREKIIERITSSWSQLEARIFVSFNKVSAFNFNILRNILKKEGSSIFVSRNSLIKRALDSISVDSMDSFIDGSTGIVFVNYDNIVKICKILFDFSKENEGFMLKGAALGEKQLGFDELEKISKLPPKDILIAQAVMGIASPLSGFVAALNNILVKFLYLIDGIKNKKSIAEDNVDDHK
ncbi:MAG: 50S ribosomal protein L10 [Candidatus Omnitrophica bacterium 4484_171]|nr:MAG: 50S ribosomal protein L10 [Candidatus Omnitrophica bacterium 4484_171]